MDAQGRPSARSGLARAFTDRDFRRRLIRYALGRPVSLETNDRRILERVILPYYNAQPDIQTVLFVGVAWYTRHYDRSYFPRKDYWTVDSSHAARRYGARQHIEALVESLPARFSTGHFDLVLMNGVYGHGIDDKGTCERSFEACYQLLRIGGHFLLGWNDVPEYRGAPLESIESLKQFVPVALPPLGTHKYETDTVYRHIYQFYRKQPLQVSDQAE